MGKVFYCADLVYFLEAGCGLLVHVVFCDLVAYVVPCWELEFVLHRESQCVKGEVVFYSSVEYVFYVFWDGFPCVAALVEDGLEEGVLQCGSRWGGFCY